MSKSLYITQKQLNEISSWMSNNPESNSASDGNGHIGVTADGYIGDGETYTSGKPVSSDEIQASMTANFFKQFGLQQGRNYRPYGGETIDDIKGGTYDFDDFDDLDYPKKNGEIEGGVNEEFNDTFLKSKQKASPTAADAMSTNMQNSFVEHFKEGNITLNALRQKVHNMEHGKSAEDPETQKQIVQAYNNARKKNASVQDAKKSSSDSISTAVKNSNSKSKGEENKPIITYFN